MSGEVKLTPEDIAFDFCQANPGQSVIVGNVHRDASGNVTHLGQFNVQGTRTGRFWASDAKTQEPKK